MAILTVKLTSRSGLDLAGSVAASSGGDQWLSDGTELLWIQNGGAASIVLTLKFNAAVAVDGQTPANRTVSVAAGQLLIVGPFPVGEYKDPGGYMNVGYSSVTSLSVLVFRAGS